MASAVVTVGGVTSAVVTVGAVASAVVTVGAVASAVITVRGVASASSQCEVWLGCHYCMGTGVGTHNAISVQQYQ